MNETLLENINRSRTANTSSVGPIWPAGEASFFRIKGFYPGLIDSQNALSEFLDAFRESCSQMNDSIFNAGAGITRVQYRAIIEADFLRRNSRNSLFRDNLEGLLRLRPNSHLGDEPVLCYVSQNSVRRLAHAGDLMNSWRNYNRVASEAQRSYSDCMLRATRNGFGVRIFDDVQSRSQNPTLLSALTSLYGTFGWNQTQVVELLADPSNILGVAYELTSQRVVSAGLAEMATVDLDYASEPFRMVELTEAATEPQFNGLGLYAAIGASLIRRVLDRSVNREIQDGEVDLVFGESNALEPAILRIAARQGREMSPEVCREFGFLGRGLLISQVPITSRYGRRGSFNHLFPSGMHRGQLYERHG